MYFSFGSLIRASTLPKRLLQTFKDTFRNLSIGVLWKYEDEMLDKPDNVYISSWMPQRDILSNLLNIHSAEFLKFYYSKPN